MALRAIRQFTYRAVQARMLYTVLTWTHQTVNCILPEKYMFYLLNYTEYMGLKNSYC